MLAFFDGDESERHGIRPFAGIDDEGKIGIGYTDANGDHGSFFGSRSDDIITSIRGLLIFMDVLDAVETFQEDLIIPCWHMGNREKSAESYTDRIRDLISPENYAQAMNMVLPELDGSLAYILDREYNLYIQSIYEELRSQRLTWTPFTDQVVSERLLLIHGKLTPDYQESLLAIQNQLPGAHSKLAENYIKCAEQMLDTILGSVEKAYRKLNAEFGKGKDDEAKNKKQKTNILETITRRFKRSELLEEVQSEKSLQSATGVERVAIGESIQHLRQIMLTPPLYPEMKVPNYHNNLMRLAQSLYNLHHILETHQQKNLPPQEKTRCQDLQRHTTILLNFINMSVMEHMPDIYSLGLRP